MPRRGRPRSANAKLQKCYQVRVGIAAAFMQVARTRDLKPTTFARDIMRAALAHPHVLTHTPLQAIQLRGQGHLPIQLYAEPEFHEAIQSLATSKGWTTSHVVQAALAVITSRVLNIPPAPNPEPYLESDP